MQEIALMVHALLVAGHALGIVYNVKRRNWFDIVAHGMAVVYDVGAIRRHQRALIVLAEKGDSCANHVVASSADMCLGGI
jgi:hypothetical protein